MSTLGTRPCIRFHHHMIEPEDLGDRYRMRCTYCHAWVSLAKGWGTDGSSMDDPAEDEDDE